jgi:predicted nucleic acid-binding protein
MQDNVFFDSNIWIYLLLVSDDKFDIDKRKKSIDLLNRYENIVISNQVLNEVANVLFKKFKLDADNIKEKLNYIQNNVKLCIITEQDLFNALDLLKKYKLSLYDGLIISAAINNNCSTLYSEDMQDKLIIESKLIISNPY